MQANSLGKRVLRLAWLGSRSLFALAVAAAVLVAGTWGSGVLAGWLDLPAGGHGRLAWDLAGLAVAGGAGLALLAWLAPAAPRAHVGVALVLLLALGLWAVTTLGAEFPAWFRTGVIVSLPLQAWVGWRLGRRPAAD